MRLLAEFIMRGRLYAACAAILGSWLPLLSQAVIGLVTLRKGWTEGLLILFVASVPAFYAATTGEVGQVIVAATLGVFLATYLQALVLRATASWEAMLVVAVGVSVAVAALVWLLSPDLGRDIGEFFKGYLPADDPAASDQIAKFWQGFTALKASGLIAFWVGFSSLAGMILSRWFQAMLYNPGGFQSEFHALRLSYPVAGVCGVAVVYCWLNDHEYTFWGNLFAAPAALAGLGLVHYALARFKWGVAAVVAVYLALLLIRPLAMVIIFLGLTDAWMDYRKKIQFKP